jgi:hypothetical protein
MTTHAITGPVKQAYLRLVAAERGLEAVGTPSIIVSVDPEALKRAEKQLGIKLEPAQLLLFSGVDVFGMYDLDLDQLATHQEEAEEAGVPATLIPLGRDGHEWVCLDKEREGLDVVVYTDNDESRRTVSLAAWLDSVVELHLHGGDSNDEERKALGSWVKKAGLEVRVKTVDKKVPSLYRIKHAKFGEGVVRREEAAGADTKLEIDFGATGGGVRILLARFVERLAK